MKLTDYLAQNGLSEADFAERLEVSPYTVKRYCEGSRVPDHRTIKRIALLTGCRVTPNDFHGVEAA